MWKKILSFLLCILLLEPVLVFANDELILGGDSIGIQLDYDGVMVSGTYAFTIKGTTYDPSSEIESGDIIQKVNGVKVQTINELYVQLGMFQENINAITIRILRNNETMDITLSTVYDESDTSYKSGLYVKDKIVGIGTMTYYDPQSQTYGALGHEIYDMDTKQIAQFHHGSIYPADVTSIQKAQQNVPGEKHAQIDFQSKMGNVRTNRDIGIYGTYDVLPESMERMPWAKQSEIKLGQAFLYTVLDHDTIVPYEIAITKLNTQQSSAVKGIEYVVVDERLKQLTNGIIQGMSGSPIVQDGKIIGAITHVITSNPMNGYGVYIEWMLETSRDLS